MSDRSRPLAQESPAPLLAASPTDKRLAQQGLRLQRKVAASAASGLRQRVQHGGGRYRCQCSTTGSPAGSRVGGSHGRSLGSLKPRVQAACGRSSTGRKDSRVRCCAPRERGGCRGGARSRGGCGSATEHWRRCVPLWRQDIRMVPWRRALHHMGQICGGDAEQRPAVTRTRPSKHAQ